MFAERPNMMRNHFGRPFHWHLDFWQLSPKSRFRSFQAPINTSVPGPSVRGREGGRGRSKVTLLTFVFQNFTLLRPMVAPESSLAQKRTKYRKIFRLRREHIISLIMTLFVLTKYSFYRLFKGRLFYFSLSYGGLPVCFGVLLNQIKSQKQAVCNAWDPLQITFVTKLPRAFAPYEKQKSTSFRTNTAPVSLYNEFVKVIRALCEAEKCRISYQHGPRSPL